MRSAPSGGEDATAFGVACIMMIVGSDSPAASTDEDELRDLRAEVSALERKLAFFQAAVDALSFPLFWKDASSRYVGCNRPQAERAGLAEGPAIEGLSDDDLPWTAEQSEGFRADDRRVMTTGQPSEIVEAQDTAAGGERVCVTRKAPLRDAEGAVMGVVGWYEDVTEREEAQRAKAILEERLRRSHKLDALGALAAGVAHDFNNVLGAIVANTTILRDVAAGDRDAGEALADIEKAAARARDLIRQILTMSRTTPERRAPLSVGGIAAEACKLLRAAIPAGVAIDVQVAADAPAIQGDASQVHQIVVNLCTNAHHAVASRPAPHIRVRVATQELEREEATATGGRLAPGRYVVLSVEDNGVGMDAETQSRLFEPYFTTRPGEGTGLGLSVVRGVVGAHGGGISVASAPNQGTTISVYFPAADAAAAAAPDSARTRPLSRAPAARMLRVLCLDDDVTVGKAVASMLRRAGYDAVVFNDPRAAMDALRKDPFDLVATDYNMPRFSGLDVARVARDARADLPVIVISGYVTEDLRREVDRLGTARVVDKAEIVTGMKTALKELLPAGPPR